MKQFFLVFCLTASLAVASAEDAKEQIKDVADKEFLRKYKLILQLFDHINQPSFHKEITDAANKFNVEGLVKKYKDPNVVKQFITTHKRSHLPQGEIFSSYNSYHIEEAKALFRLFYHAQDFNTLFEIASWARQNLNAGVFLYSFPAALTHRDDCKGYNIPPIYEIYPHYFFSSDVIEKAAQCKQHFKGKANKCPTEKGFDGYTINSNYSGNYLNLHPDQALVNYYLEDIGINGFFYYYNLYYPYWMTSQDLGETETFYKRGEVFYFHVQETLARFYLERLANQLGDIPEFEWDIPFETGYVPSLRYPNGLDFPSRPNHANLRQTFRNPHQKNGPSTDHQYSYTHIQDYSRRLRDALDEGYIRSKKKDEKPTYILNEEGLDIVGNMIEGNAESPNPAFFGNILLNARHLLGYSYQPKHKYLLAPSAIEHTETSLRDPAFYQLYKHLYYFMLKYKNSLAPYTKEDLQFPGVVIKNVEFEKLVTHFDYFYSDLSNAVYLTKKEAETESFKIRVKQYRLNQKPFNYKIHVESDKDNVASIRVYIGPKYDERGETIDMNDNRINFVQFDYFPYKLKAGENVIERKSSQLFEYCDERTPYREMYQNVLNAESGQKEFKIKPDEICYPRRVALPKGTDGGTPYQFYIMVSPYKTSDSGAAYDDTHQYPVYRMDEYALGYPFDRRVEDAEYYKLPNAYIHTEKVYFDDTIDKNHPF